METVEITKKLIDMKQQVLQNFFMPSQIQREAVMNALVNAYSLGVTDCSDMLEKHISQRKS